MQHESSDPSSADKLVDPAASPDLEPLSDDVEPVSDTRRPMQSAVATGGSHG